MICLVASIGLTLFKIQMDKMSLHWMVHGQEVVYGQNF